MLSRRKIHESQCKFWSIADSPLSVLLIIPFGELFVSHSLQFFLKLIFFFFLAQALVLDIYSYKFLVLTFCIMPHVCLCCMYYLGLSYFSYSVVS